MKTISKKMAASALAFGLALSLGVMAQSAPAQDRRHGDNDSDASRQHGGGRGQRDSGGNTGSDRGQRDNGGNTGGGNRQPPQTTYTPPPAQPAPPVRSDAGRNFGGGNSGGGNSGGDHQDYHGRGGGWRNGSSDRDNNHGSGNTDHSNGGSRGGNGGQWNGNGNGNGNGGRGDRNDHNGNGNNNGWNDSDHNDHDRNDRNDHDRNDHDRGGYFRNDRRFEGYSGVRFGFYYSPDRGYYSAGNYYDHRWMRGEYLPEDFYFNRIYDWDYYDLPAPPFGCAWYLVGTSAVLVNMSSGRIIDVIYDLY